MKALHSIAMDHSEDQKEFEKDLLNIARTTLSSKLLIKEKEFFAKLAVKAALQIADSGNLELI